MLAKCIDGPMAGRVYSVFTGQTVINIEEEPPGDFLDVSPDWDEPTPDYLSVTVHEYAVRWLRKGNTDYAQLIYIGEV